VTLLVLIPDFENTAFALKIGGQTMKKRSNPAAQGSKTKVKKNNRRSQPIAQNGGIRVLRVKKGESLKSIYAKLRKAFTAADLQKYTETEEGIPFDQIIAEVDRAQQEWEKKNKKQHEK
jgi:hypothetical protein